MLEIQVEKFVNLSSISEQKINNGDRFPLSFECEGGHTIRDWSGKCDQGHNVPYYRTVECPVKLCGFHSKPGYVEDHIDKGWTQVRDHFLAAHGYRLQSEVLKESASGKNVLPPVDI